jgi:hypothetical protein
MIDPRPEHHPTALRRLARGGFAARSVVYITIGALAVLAAIGHGGTTTGPHGALRELFYQPFGGAILAALSVGLFAYALWRIVDAVRDVSGKGRSAKGLAVRAGKLGSALIHGGWGLAAMALVVGSGGGGSDDAVAHDGTARLLAQPFGPWLVGGIGVGLAIFALDHLRRAWRASFLAHVEVERLSRRALEWVTAIGRCGIGARGVTLGIIAAFLLLAAWRHDSSQARGLAGSLDALWEQPFGPALLGIVAVGVIAFGVHNLFLARWYAIAPRA